VDSIDSGNCKTQELLGSYGTATAAVPALITRRSVGGAW
jgi:hypothetical protein